jgi:hypothetical protein
VFLCAIHNKLTQEALWSSSSAYHFGKMIVQTKRSWGKRVHHSRMHEVEFFQQFMRYQTFLFIYVALLVIFTGVETLFCPVAMESNGKALKPVARGNAQS